jgi:hypothetical protein
MVKKNILVVFCILQAAFCHCSNYPLDKFIARFPIVEWIDLDSLRRIKFEDLNLSMDTIGFDETNCIIWGGSFFLPHESYYGESVHVSDFPSPHIRKNNSKYRGYMDAYLGKFIINEGKRYNEDTNSYEPSGEFSKLYPLGRVEIDDIIIFVIGYKFIEEFSDFKYSTDVYIFDKVKQRLLSAFCLSGHNPAYTILYEDYRITSYESYDTMEDVITDRYVYKIASDGFLTEISEEKNIPEFTWKTVVDSDGYVNVRNNPNVKSEILYTIPAKSQVLCHQLKDSNWVEVIEIKGSNRIGGYVHNSRLK